MSLLTICTNALKELSGFELPSSFYDNTNLTARACVALVTREMKSLEREHRWVELITTHTFTTTNGTAYYALPSDFRAFANLSQWDRTNSRRLVGPASGAEWQWLKGDVAAGATIDRWFRVEGARIYIHPTPSVTGDTIAFDYYSKSTVTLASDSTYATDWANDNDTSRLDEELLTMGLKWRFLQSKGMPFEPEYREYESIKDELLADNGGKRMITLGLPSITPTNLPDRGFGQ